MSVIFKSILDMNKSNSNTSSAKYQYSFGKAPRFREDLPSMPKCYEISQEIKEQRIKDLEDKLKYKRHDFYYLPSTKSNRYANFGLHPEHKNLNKNRSKTLENLYTENNDKTLSKEELIYKFAENDFERKYFHGPKYSFPHGRENDNKIKKNGIKLELDGITPGPGDYNILKPFGSDAPKILIRGHYDRDYEEKKRQLLEKNEKKEKPYLPDITIQIRPTGKYSVSHIPNVNCIKLQKTEKEKMIENLKQSQDENALKRLDKIVHPFNNPGPGAYTIFNKIPTKDPKKPFMYPKTLMGVISESKYRSNPPITFGKSKPKNIIKSHYPGPGSYRLPSDFGIYVNKGCEEYPEENVYPVKKIPFEEKAWRHGMKKIVEKKEEDNQGNNNIEDEKEIQDNNENSDKDIDNKKSPKLINIFFNL
jgi:hypothetical protein